MTKNTHESYDEVPYHSYPYSNTMPEKLAMLGTLFGMNTPELENARVLELGCASGGNLIPHALKYPKAEFIGVDLSKAQIDSAKQQVKALNLKNIEFKHCSITDIDNSFGKFDYIICHGVISWVPDFVQDKIFEVSKENLKKNGVAYISYNTLPGWNMVRAIRDMMLYHSQSFHEKEKVVQARALLDFVKESLEGADTPYANMLRQEAELISNQRDDYIRHDHLEDNNKQFYFDEFMEKAKSKGLQYLADASLASMYLGNLNPEVAKKLSAINDIVRVEQYMDFVNNRRFRSTLLCHDDVKLNRSISNEDIKKFTLTFDITAEKQLKDINISDNEPATFYYKGKKDLSVKTSSLALKAVFYSFIKNFGCPKSFDEIVEESKKIAPELDKKQIENEMLNNLMNLVMKGFIDLHLLSRKSPDLVKPKVSELVHYQLKEAQNEWVTNISHAPINVNFFEKAAMKYMDGQNTSQQIIDLLMQEVKDKKIILNSNEGKIEDEKRIQQEISAHLNNAITKLAVNSILE